ncbi:MAG: 6-phosphogluconolactonase [Acidimicrobiia bacterium]|nr:6-phosphogluconolactonase [Acidimicrobiia bacterium]
MTIHIADDSDLLAELAADVIAERLSSAGPDIGLAGGGTPRSTYRRLSHRDVKWATVTAWMTDERHVRPDHPDSNAGMAQRVLFDHVAGTLHAVSWRESADEAAHDYARRLAGFLPAGVHGPTPTTVVLGVGGDGHTASLFPGSAALAVTDRDFVATQVPRHGTRLTATLPLLSRARLTVFLVSGGHKAEIVATMLSGDSDLPAARVARAAPEVVWLLDRDAARLL